MTTNAPTKGSPRSPIMAAIHEAVEGLRDIGLVDDLTLRGFDERCLTASAPQRREAHSHDEKA